MNKEQGFELKEQEFEGFDEWVDDRLNEMFRVDHFKSIGKGEDYIFQSLVFTGEGSHLLSLATTILGDLEEVPEDLKVELKSIQGQLHEFQDKLRNVKGGN